MHARFEKDQVEIVIKLSKTDQTDPKNSDEYASVQEIENKKFLILLEPYFVHSLTRLHLENMTVKDWLIQRQLFYGRNPALPKNLSISKHINAQKMIESILLHEASHVYDMLEVPNMKYLKTRLSCIQAAAATGPIGTNSSRFMPECQVLTKIESSVSTLPEFLHVAGWPERGFLFPENQYINNNGSGIHNYKEAGSPYESFAVNMEFFLLDPQFKCHRPNLYTFLEDYFRYSPYPSITCHNSKKVLLSNSDFLFSKDQSKPLFEFAELDESKLYEIHYLYAGKNNQMMSKFGHGMLRLVFCDPDRTEVGPDCLKDTKYHMVASFAAFIGDVQINPLDGLFGGYAAHLFMSRLSETLETYNDTELREVYSLPLRLNRERKHKLLKAIYEAHWSYRGNYSFISNNCAIETHSLIKTAFLNVPSIIDSYVVRPDSLFSLLQTLKVGDGSIYSTPEKAFNYGYFFPSLRSHYEASLKILTDKKIVSSDVDLDEYVGLKPKERVSIISQTMQIENKVQRGIARMAARKLESLSLKKFYQDSLQSKMPEIIKKLKSDGASYGIDKDQVISFIKKLSIPGEALELTGNYGIPSEETVNESIKISLESVDKTYINRLKENVIKFIFSCLDKEQIATLEDFGNNLEALK